MSDNEQIPQDVEETTFDPTLKKKKKKKAKIVTEEEIPVESSQQDVNTDDIEDIAIEAVEESTDGEPWIQSCSRDYTYPELLSRVFRLLRANNPELAGEKRRYTIVPPQVARDGNKKTVFVNIVDICKRMNRSAEHVIQFLFAELGTNGSVDGSQRLVIKGRFQQKQIENVLRRYIVEYVTCKTCKSPDTILRKENRLYFMQCEACGSTRSVAAIKAGFQVQTSRKAARAKAV